MSDENQYEDAQVVDEAVEPEPAPEVNLEAEAKKAKAKAVKYRVVFTSPLGRVGSVVTVDPKDHRVKHLISIGGLEKV
jgi:hypothetical protein